MNLKSKKKQFFIIFTPKHDTTKAYEYAVVCIIMSRIHAF